MLAIEKHEILARLEEGHLVLSEAVRGVDQHQVAWKSSEQSWSIQECVEHLVLSEEYLLSRLTLAEASPTALSNPVREARIIERGHDRSVRVESPDVGRPCGRYTNLREAMAGFSAVRSRTIAWVETMTGGPRSLLTNHPLIPGPVNCFEILLLISVHPRRHAEQIKSIRSNFVQARSLPRIV